MGVAQSKDLSLFLGPGDRGCGLRNFSCTGTLTVANGGLFSTASTVKVWDGGTVVLDGGTLTATGGLTLTSAELKGSGTINGNVTSTGTTCAPGASLTFSATDVLQMELAGSALAQFDRFVVADSVNLGGATLNLSLLAGFEAAAVVNDTLRLIDNTSSSPILAQFAGLSEGATIILGADQFTASYVGGTGNDFVLTVTQVPQPGSAALLLGGLGLLAARRRRAQGRRAWREQPCPRPSSRARVRRTAFRFRDDAPAAEAAAR